MASENLLRYIWETQIMPQAGYSFSRLHSVGYSLIALQEMNLAHKYPQVYWNTACLSVNAGADESNDDNKGTKYGKVAAAIGNMNYRGVKVSLPDINKSKFGFSPNPSNNSIVFGLKGINGIGDDVCHAIIENRPYQSFEDFVERMFLAGMVKKGHVIQLIKAGCFDAFGERSSIMESFIESIAETKKKLTIANLKQLIEYDLIPTELNLQKRFFKFKAHISKSVHRTTTKPKDRLLKLDGLSASFFNDHFSDEHIVNMEDNLLIISEKSFKKEYDEKIAVLKQWLKEEAVLNNLNQKIVQQEFNKYAVGGYSKWEMDSVSFYYHDHELSHVNKEKYGVDNYFNLPEDPVVIDTYKHRGREINVFDTTRIVGTVLDKDKNKHSITLLTPDGVVTVKLYSGAFSHYSRQLSVVGEDGKKTVIEKSWFTRGNKLLISGYRRGNKFTPKVYNNSIYSHTVCLIEDIDNKGNLTLKTEREHV